jgi:hypothetical protein
MIVEMIVTMIVTMIPGAAGGGLTAPERRS